MQPDQRLFQRALTLSMALFAAGFAVSAQPVPQEETVGDELRVPLDAELAPWRARLLETAYDAASAMPLFPHVKNRSRAQEEVVETCLALDQPTRALRFTEGIENWRRGAGYAAYAYYCAEAGFERYAAAYLARADEVSKTSPDAQEQGWRRDRIQATIARTHLLLGNEAKASTLAASMETNEAASVDRMRARSVDPRALGGHLERVQEIAVAGDLDQTRGALGTCLEFYDRFFGEAEPRDEIESAMRASWGKLPVEMRIELLSELSAIAARHADRERALRLVDEAQALADGFQWVPEHGLKVFSGLVLARHTAGDPTGARERADAAFVLYQSNRDKIVDVFRASALRPLAEAYQALGAATQARNVYRMALEEGRRNPNSRPRSQDLTSILCSLARHGVEPTAGMWELIVKSREELGDPW